MKKTRRLAWLLIVAMLTMACPAFGEALDIVQADGDAQEALAVGIELEAASDGDEQEALVDVGSELLADDPDTDQQETDSTGDSAAADAVANGNAGGMQGDYIPSGAADNDALFAGYVDMLFDRLPQRNGYVGDKLTGVKKVLYDYLLSQIEKIAAGKRSNTAIDIPLSVIPQSKWEEAFYAFSEILDILLADCPYHLFWYDKTRSTSYGAGGGRPLYCDLPVADEYARSTYETDAEKIGKAHIAVRNAKKVVRKSVGVSDYRKLCNYRDYICKHVNYNDAAVKDESTPYGNPWQLIWAFDGDPSTDIVCEGYSKAFQYLCDLSSFNDNIRCYTVSGEAVFPPDDGGPHMWNIVRMEDGRNYHVDITFCDTGAPEDFLVGTPDAAEDGGYFYVEEAGVRYILDAATLGAFPKKMLKLSTSDYDPDKPEPTAIAIVQGDSATAYMGNPLALKTKMTPKKAVKELTWTSSKPEVAAVSGNGLVTPKQVGKTVITVTTANGLSAKIAVQVVDASSIKIKEGRQRKLTIYKKLALHVKASPSKVKPRLTWTSSNKKVATVSKKGVVKAVGLGTATITATTANGKSAKIVIKVVDKKPEEVYRVTK